MKTTLNLWLIISSSIVMAQNEHISKGEIPLGIKVYDYQKEQAVDVASICDGFDSDGLPQNLVLPNNCQIALFLPSITEDNANHFLISRGAKTPRGISNLSYDFNSKRVAFIGNISYAGGQRDRLEVIYFNDTLKLFPTRSLHFEWRSDQDPLTMELFIENEEIDERAKWNDSILNNLFSSSAITKNYDYWLEKGYANELDDRGLPVNPVFAQSDDVISFTTNAPSVQARRDGEAIDFIREYSRSSKSNDYYFKLNKPGTYTIQIENKKIKYGQSKLTYTLSVKYSFWKQGGYYFIIAFIVFLLVFLFYRYNTQRKMEKTLLQKQLSEAELKAVRAQLNPHFIFNCLSAIQNLVNHGQNETADDYIVKFSRLLRMVLAQSEESFHAIEDEISLSKLYLELEYLRKPFDFDIDIDNQVNQNALIPNMLLQPYLENAIIHGVQRHGANKIQLDVQQLNGQIKIEIKDNGRQSSAQFTEGKGMSLVRNRIEMLKNQLGVEMGIKAFNGPDKGFKVEIVLPDSL
ncbi:MAG: histidine kinase [Bacteroidota bacterium]